MFRSISSTKNYCSTWFPFVVWSRLGLISLCNKTRSNEKLSSVYFFSVGDVGSQQKWWMMRLHTMILMSPVDSTYFVLMFFAHFFHTKKKKKKVDSIINSFNICAICCCFGLCLKCFFWKLKTTEPKNKPKKNRWTQKRIPGIGGRAKVENNSKKVMLSSGQNNE